MHLSLAIPGGTTPGHTKEKQGDIGVLEANIHWDPGEIAKFVSPIWEGEGGGGISVTY